MSKQLDPDKDFVSVNQVLGQKASIGPVPADQFFPIVGLAAFSFFFIYMLLGLGFKWWIAISTWLIASWWLLTGKKSYRYINKWIKPPGADWINYSMLWVSASNYRTWKRKVSERIGPVKVETEKGFKSFMPFQNYSDLHAIAQIEMGGHSFACLLLCDQKKEQWSAVIPFKFSGLHPQLYQSEIQQHVSTIRKGMSELLPGEYLTMMIGCYSDYTYRVQQLEELANNCEIVPISVFLRNEQQRIRELTQKGTRQIWKQYYFCTWTATRAGESKQDFVGNTLRWLVRGYNKWVRKFAGTEEIHLHDFYCNLGRQIYEGGYLPWRLLLETKSELNISPMNSQEIWEWLWYRFNKHKAPKLDQFIQIWETEKGLEKSEPVSGQKDLLSILIQGESGHSNCPRHKGSHERIYVNQKVCGVLVMEEPPDGWINTRASLQWIWSRLSNPYVHDTEAWLEVTNADQSIAIDNLIKISKQSTTANRRALEDGSGRNILASIRQEQSFDAQRRILEGALPLHCAPVFLVYRDSAKELDEACALLCNSFGRANVVRERDVAWNIWLETLPINSLRLLQSNKISFSERRCYLDSESVLGLMPLTRPKPLASKGVEFLTAQGGQPIYVDLFEQTSRCLITAASGGGKSVLGWRFIMDALAQGIPVVGIDLSSGGDSTFKTAVKMLGDDGAYIEILHESLNLIEPPDLFDLKPDIQVQRMKRWQDFVRQAIVAIAMGQISDEQQLHERVESITVRLLEIFFSDPEIIDRYNCAFEHGWKSKAWQNIPTLHDLIKFCSKEKLGLTSVEEIDRRAINQIYNQIETKLADPNIGDAIGRPSTVSPNPYIKFFALSGLSSESNSYVMAISAQMACLRMALSYPKSLFVGDELSVLLAKDGFAALVGEIQATGRKEGLSSLILAQDLESIRRCSAADKILGNQTYIITGVITSASVNSYVESLSYDREIISKNATEKFLPFSAEYYTCWLIEKSKRFWDCHFHAGPMMLAALASGEDEQAARERILANYPKTIRGYLQGIHHFSKEYILAARGNKSLKSIGFSELNNQTQRKLPQSKIAS